MPKKHRVTQGEYLASIARTHGFASWRKIYDHPDNAVFRRKRPNPNVISPGDIITIPDPEKSPVDAATERKHRFRLKQDPLRLRVKLRNFDGKALAGEPYQLTVGETVLEGTTSQDGMIDHPLTGDESRGEIMLTNLNLALPLKIGHLDPVDDQGDQRTVVTGAQGRLNNLGYFCGAVDGDAGELTRLATLAFQRQVLERSEPDGQLDKETLDCLKSEHGC